MTILDQQYDLTYAEEITVVLFITPNCNFACSYCIVWNKLKPAEPSEILYIDESFINNFIHFCWIIDSRNINLKIVWWEPLLNKPTLLLFLEKISAKSLFKNIYITTNAFYVDVCFLEMIKTINSKHGNTIKIKVSYDWNLSLARWNKILNDNTLNKILLIKKYIGTDCLVVSSVISQYNYDNMFKNFRGIIDVISPWEFMYGLEKWAVWSIESTEKIKREYLKLFYYYYKNKDSINVKMDFWENEDKEYRPCSKWMDHFITYEGLVYPCYSYFSSNMSQKYAFSKNISEIKEKKQMDELLDWGKDYYKVKFDSWMKNRRIDHSHCYFSKLKKEDTITTFNNVTDFSDFKKICYEKMSN